MLDTLMSMLRPPAHANTGEAFHLHQTLNAYHYLRAKCLLYEAHCQDKALLAWWRNARVEFIEPHMKQSSALMEKLGIPRPPTLPEWNVLTDQFMAIDGAAMVEGMLEAHMRGLTVSRRPDIAAFYNKVFESALIAGAELMPILEREGWLGAPPAYPASTTP